MKQRLLFLISSAFLIGIVACTGASQSENDPALIEDAFGTGKSYVLVIHGGAGTINRESMTPEREQEYHTALERALQAGYEVLKNGGSSLDAVEHAVHVLEDTPLFNAGKGAVFTNEGKNELDASIMDGATGQAGAVAGVTVLRNPISAARAVMEKSAHVLLVGAGAEKFAIEQGLETVDPSYFFTQHRWDILQRNLKRDSLKAAEGAAENTMDKTALVQDRAEELQSKMGTVGCVALDQFGNIAAGTSTGGMTNKRFGRVGDAPIIGAGTFANKTVGVSCTGWGEFYIRNVVAYDIAAMMDYKNMSLSEAAQAAMNKVSEAGGSGGVIALDKDGNLATPYSTSGMYRGAVTKDGKFEVAIF